jgi:exodeoxyribonuclease VII large subunit
MRSVSHRPDKLVAMSQAALFEPEQTLGVGELVARVTKVVAAAFPAEVWVRGEIHGLKQPNSSGHQYFELSERNNRRGPASTLPVALFRLERQRVLKALREYPDFHLADGIEVRVRGRIQYGYGRVSLVMSAIDPVHTLGKLAADRQRVLQALRADGLLDANRALPLPVLPLRIGLVTSHGSAAFEDAVQELSASGIGFQVRVADARVQGTSADLSMVRALTALRAEACDVILLVRGGGSRTDLVAFDSERLARTIATMSVPVLTGVGHEIDSSIVDEVAHASYKTPTACAAAVVERARAAIARAEGAWTQTAEIADRRLTRAERQLAGIGTRVSPNLLRPAERALDDHARHVARAARAALDRQHARCELFTARTTAADPARLFARGWTITHTADGRLVRSPADAPPGTELVTTLGAGHVRSEVVPDA